MTKDFQELKFQQKQWSNEDIAAFEQCVNVNATGPTPGPESSFSCVHG
jgi:hypothetical protein